MSEKEHKSLEDITGFHVQRLIIGLVVTAVIITVAVIFFR
jgi:hypothetical protein